MTPKYAWFYFLDSITAPTLWTGFGLGVTFATGVFSLFHRALMRKADRKVRELQQQQYAEAARNATTWALPPWRQNVRPPTLKPDHHLPQARITATELEMPSRHNVWLHVQHHDDIATFHLALVDEERQVTTVYALTPPQAVQLADWLSRICLPASGSSTTHTEDAQ